MKWVMAAVVLFMMAVTVSYAKDAQGTGKAGRIEAVQPQAAQSKPVNQMVDVKAKEQAKAPDQAQQAAEEKTGEKAVATWTNPAGKEITNHGMAKKLENQEKNAAKKEAKAGEETVPEVPEVVPADEDAPIVPDNLQLIEPDQAEEEK